MLRKTFVALAIGLALVGCGAKDEPYKEVKRAPEERAWKAFDNSDLWLYVPSTGDAPRYASNMDPFFQGEEKVVQLRFVDGAMRVMEVDQDKTSTEQDSRWNDVAPVLEIPGRYSDYRCALDKYNECTNQEEENNDANVAWDKKRYFIPDFKNIRDIEVNTNQVWFHDDRVRETGSPRVVRWEMDADQGVINVEVERTFTVTPENLTELSSSNSFTTSFYYSLVKLDKLATKSYQPIRYNVDEQSEFGFFTSDFSKLDNQGMPSDGSNRSYLNRFDPHKSTIDYYLSDTFFKPENKLFLDETLSTIALLNRSLQGTGVPALRIVNPDAAAGRMVGDLRNNMINLIDRPLANGLLGYGPSVANPLTGEIVQAHVNQYSGVIKTTVPRVWNNLARSYLRGDFAAAGNVGYAGVDFEKLATSTAGSSKVKAELDDQQIAESGKQFSHRKLAFEPFNAKLSIKRPDESTSLSERGKIDEQRLRRWTEKDCAFGEEAIWVSATEKGIIKGIDYTDPALYVDGIPDNHHLKRWTELSSQQQATISDAVSAHVYRSTLVHELGHNLGLRHNFAGSTDKANFYTHEQLHALGLEMEKIPAYSSIMDYSASEFDELPVFGPYDRAALRFAYQRAVEVNYDLYNKDGAVLDASNQPQKATGLVDLSGLDSAYYQGDSSVKYGPLNYVSRVLANPASADASLPGYISSWSSVPGLYDTLVYAASNDRPSRKAYAFCTDGNVSLNSNCKRFDEGTDLYEMMLYKRQSYFDSYERRNTRYNRQEFWSNDLASYTVRRFNEFSEIRDFLEDYERIDRLLVDNYTAGGSAPGEFLGSLVLNKNYCGSSKADAWFCKYGKAAIEAANFLVDVVARPDKVCELKDSDGNISQKPMGELFELVKYDLPSGKSLPASCFDEEFSAALAAMPMGYSVLSETRDGAPLNSVGTNSPDHPYSNELDVIGTWPDKLLAMEYLVSHYSNRYTEEGQAMSLVDLPGVRSRLLALVNAMALEQPSPEPVVYVDRDGKVVTPHEPYTWKRSSQLESLSPDLFFLRRHFGLPTSANVGISKAVIAQIPNFAATSDSDMQSSARALIDYVSLPANAYDSVSGRKVELQGKVYNIGSSNTLANRMVDYKFVGSQPMADYIAALDDASYSALKSHASAAFGNLFELSSLMASEPQLLNLVDGAARLDSSTVQWLMTAERQQQSFDALLATLTVSKSGLYASPVAVGKAYSRADLATLWSGTRALRTSLKPQFHDLVTGWVVQLSSDVASLRADSSLSAAEQPLWAAGKVQGLFVTLAADADINSADSSRFEQALNLLTRNVE